MSYLLQLIVQFAQWLWDVISNFPLHVLSLGLQGLQALLNWIPAPAFFGSAAGYIGDLPPLLAWLLGAFQVGAGVTILVTAYTLRFVIRRIPFIG